MVLREKDMVDSDNSRAIAYSRGHAEVFFKRSQSPYQPHVSLLEYLRIFDKHEFEEM